MTRTSRRKTDEETAETFLRMHVRGFVDGELTPARAEELHQAVYEIFGDMARDGCVREDNAYGESHFSYVLLSNTGFVSEFDNEQAELRDRIDWMDELNVKLEATKVTVEELDSMETYTQDIDLSSLFELGEQVKEATETGTDQETPE